jgi:hypothetical protein
LARACPDLLRHRVQVLERLGGGDDELHRQARGARQRRELEGHHLGAGDAVPAWLQVGWISCALRVRWSQGLSSTPAMPALVLGTPVSWNICSYSGVSCATLKIWSA